MKHDLSPARQALEALRKAFLKQIPVRLAAIEQGWIDCYMASDPAPPLRELMRLAHNLCGTAKTYGLMTLGNAAAELEAGIQPWVERMSAPLPAARAQLDALVAALVQAAHADNAPSPLQPAPAVLEAQGPAPALIYLHESDQTHAQRLATQLENFGYRTRCYATPEALQTALELEHPDVMLCDCGSQGDFYPVTSADRRGGTPPVIFISARDNSETRLRAVQAGGEAFLAKPVDFGKLLEEVDRVTGRMPATPYRILVVEDDASLARYYRSLLQDSGLEALSVSEPLQVLQALADFSPDLVLMDVYMPGCTGAEMAQVIRQHGAHGGIPIVFLSAENDPDIQYAALRTGGDDFLTKPVDPKLLLRTVTVRAQRARLLSALMTRDGLTGLLNHSRIKEMLIGELTRARRSNAPLSVAMLDLDHFKSINDRYGHMSGDRVIKGLARLLRERLRSSDLAGRYGGEEFLVVLPDCDFVSAQRLIDDIRARFAELPQCGESIDQSFEATFSAGLAVFPPTSSADSLLLEADAALYEAKRKGRNQVCSGQVKFELAPSPALPRTPPLARRTPDS